jgi:FkbM family methyltransferase
MLQIPDKAKQFLRATPMYRVVEIARARRRLAEWTLDDARMLAFYAQFIGPSDMVFDIGANVGSRVKIFRRLARSVVAIEPQDRCMSLLRWQFSSDRSVRLVKKAVAAEEGSAIMRVCIVDTMSSLAPDWINAVKTTGRFADLTWERQVSVETTTLDRLIDECGTPSFIKIDVEGYEWEVLRGLSQPVRALSFEYTPEYKTAGCRCVQHLASLAPMEFNYCPGAGFQFARAAWLAADEMIAALSSLSSDAACGDVYARSAG